MMIRFALAVFVLSSGLQAPPAPGFTLAFDGGVFKQETVFLKATGATSYGNAVVRYTRSPRLDRVVVGSDALPGALVIEINADPRVGTTSYDRKDEDDPNRNRYRGFGLNAGEWAAGRGYRFDLVHVDVTISRFDEPGGRIEGTIQGTFELCTLPGDGGGNCTARAPLELSGRFSVVRQKDHVYE